MNSKHQDIQDKNEMVNKRGNQSNLFLLNVGAWDLLKAKVDKRNEKRREKLHESIMKKRRNDESFQTDIVFSNFSKETKEIEIFDPKNFKIKKKKNYMNDKKETLLEICNEEEQKIKKSIFLFKFRTIIEDRWKN